MSPVPTRFEGGGRQPGAAGRKAQRAGEPPAYPTLRHSGLPLLLLAQNGSEDLRVPVAEARRLRAADWGSGLAERRRLPLWTAMKKGPHGDTLLVLPKTTTEEAPLTCCTLD